MYFESHNFDLVNVDEPNYMKGIDTYLMEVFTETKKEDAEGQIYEVQAAIFATEMQRG